MAQKTPLEIFRLIATEFSEVTDETVLEYMDIYKDLISARKFGTLYPKALALLTAHYLKLAGLGIDSLGAGSIADRIGIGSVSEGETSVSFGTNQATNMGVDGLYSLTLYGLQYLDLRRLVSIGIVSAGESFGIHC